jgi:hypothetical protein
MTNGNILLPRLVQRKIKLPEDPRHSKEELSMRKINPNAHARSPGERHEMPAEFCFIIAQPTLWLESVWFGEDVFVGVEQVGG